MFPTPPDADEAMLIDEASRGNHRAFALLYERYKASVKAQLARRISSALDREDLTQLVFLQLFRALPSFRGAAKLSTFLFRITTNVTCDHLRKRYRTPAFLQDEKHLHREPDRGCPEDPVASWENLRSLEQRFHRLAARSKLAFQLLAVEGYTLREVSERTGRSSTSIKVDLARARSELKLTQEKQAPHRRMEQPSHRSRRRRDLRGSPPEKETPPEMWFAVPLRTAPPALV